MKSTDKYVYIVKKFTRGDVMTHERSLIDVVFASEKQALKYAETKNMMTDDSYFIDRRLLQ